MRSQPSLWYWHGRKRIAQTLNIVHSSLFHQHCGSGCRSSAGCQQLCGVGSTEKIVQKLIMSLSARESHYCGSGCCSRRAATSSKAMGRTDTRTIASTTSVKLCCKTKGVISEQVNISVSNPHNLRCIKLQAFEHGTIDRHGVCDKGWSAEHGTRGAASSC